MHFPIRPGRASWIALVAMLGLGVTACGDSDDTASSIEESPTTVQVADAGVEITGVWARTSPMMTTAGAAYMEITSATGDRLVAASVDPAIAGKVEIHEVAPVESSTDDMSDMSDEEPMDSAMMMRELEGGLELPAGDTVVLQPGGYHVMLLDLPEPLVVGQSFELVLSFENAGDEVVTVEVRDEAP